jgi:predicted small secreted protein
MQYAGILLDLVTEQSSVNNNSRAGFKRKEFCMKTKKSFLMGAAFILIAAVVLAGCATTKGNGDPALPPPIPDTPAERLAADLNAIEAESATVEGATVKLSDEVQLTTGLTVPAGVTLDLTADGVKIELQNGAELTVDGTVNTSGHGDHGNGWVAGGLRIGDGIAVINGSGTIRLQSKGYLLHIWDKTHLTLDGVTLVGIADNDSPLVAVGESGELVMKSGSITGNTTTSSGGGVSINDGSTFTMEGGTITGNTTGSRGGGVRIYGGSFTMSGSAAISGNTATGGGGGGGVSVGGGTFTMSGSATISGNTATSSGGVAVFNDAAFTKTGGVIYGSNETNTSLRNVVKDAEGAEQTDRGAAVHADSTHRRETTVGAGQNLSRTSDETYTGQCSDEE